MVNSLLCTKYDKCIHGRLAEIKRATANMAVCTRCKNKFEGRLVEKLRDDKKKVNGFCYSGDKLNPIGSCEVVVTTRTNRERFIGVVEDRRY